VISDESLKSFEMRLGEFPEEEEAKEFSSLINQNSNIELLLPMQYSQQAL